MSGQEGAHAPSKPRGRIALVISVVLNFVLIIALVAVADPMGIKKPKVVFPPTAGNSAPAPTPPQPSTRPAYQFAPSSDKQVDGSLQCPDAGSVAAGKGNDKTEIVTVEGSTDKPILLLGPNRRVVIAQDAIMTGPVIMCGDGGTLLIIGYMQGPVVMRGGNVKIVVQDGGKEKLPPAYSTSNGVVTSCTTKGAANTPDCDSYRPRPGAKPNG